MRLTDLLSAFFLYVVSLAIFIGYLYKKYKIKGFVLSICNAYIFQYVLMLFLITPLAFTPKAWLKLLGTAAYAQAPVFYPYLLKSLEINCFGFLIFIISLWKFEFSHKNANFIYKRTKTTEKYTVRLFLNVEFFIALAVWMIYSIFVKGGFSLFGTLGNSGNGAIYYINQATQIVITIMTLYYGIEFINKKKNLFLFLLGIISCVLMGKRATLVMDILWGVVVYALYRRVKLSRKVFKKAIKYAVLLVLLAIAIGKIRSSSSNFTIFENLIYGNTFCDIRDGGMILYGFEKNAQNEWAMGRTYLSAVLSFIPSSFSELRLKWDWGRYSTETLLGWKNHPGLRGGWAMEGYLNFGIMGIILSQIVSAKIYADMEKFFYLEMISSEQKEIHEKAILSLYIYVTLARRITCSAGFFAVYVLLLLRIINNFIGQNIKKCN